MSSPAILRKSGSTNANKISLYIDLINIHPLIMINKVDFYLFQDVEFIFSNLESNVNDMVDIDERLKIVRKIYERKIYLVNQVLLESVLVFVA